MYKEINSTELFENLSFLAVMLHKLSKMHNE